ncbi:DegT/DnrJ/EryC1/StrS family aminotransferase [Catenuloplanes japonicus]|uniref:DegT/DnrJ/EryC1/StrS family aminotransferase n=1 Tax=Catenuloplanes japonicus TaxID=33876 RepID=UPI000526A046|nr:aminotransferase class I/II-fold pyridoxal phosphate-dependent enzyme [Catenuloplanes japonicus]
MLPYGRQSIDDEDIAAVTAALRGDFLTTGPTVGAFEAALSARLGGPGCVAVTSGTAALHVAYAAIGIRPGDEVITTPITFVATAAAAVLQGAKVVFADVEAETANLDAAAVDALVTTRTRAITAVDYAGHPAEYEALTKVARRADVTLIADAAHSIGSTYRGVPVGSLADVTTLSFFPTKNVTTGEGGAVAATDPAVLDRARRFANQGTVRERELMRAPDEGGWFYETHSFGLNYRLPDVLCALGLSQLRRLGQFKAARARLVARYHEMLADVPGLTVPAQRAWADPMWHLYPVRIADGRRREVYDRMRAAGVGVQVNYVPVHLHPVFQDLGYRAGMCPVAERFYSEELSLPLFADLTDADQERAVEALRAVLG